MRKARGFHNRPGLREEMLLADSERNRERGCHVADGQETSDACAAQGRVVGCGGVAGSIRDLAHGGSCGVARRGVAPIPDAWHNDKQVLILRKCFINQMMEAS